MVEKIDYSKTLGLKDKQYIDTRSPAEFEADHIPGSVNIPIFDNVERALVGTIYTKISRDVAFEKGKGIYLKKIEKVKQEIRKFNKKKKQIIYCWRGGMRSKAIAGLAEELGYDTYQLNGGYKNYRRYVREQLQGFRLRSRLLVLHGLTGCGKTEILQYFRDMIDLEGLAQHRSSVFGAIGLNPRTQKMFESLLLVELGKFNSCKYILIEGESRKIGNTIMPEFLYKAMKNGINIRVECSFENRVRRSKKVYLRNQKEHTLLKSIVSSLQKKLGKQTTAQLLSCIESNQHNSFTGLLLRKYYDPLYRYSIDSITYDLRVNSDSIKEAVSSIKRAYPLQ